MTRDAELRTRSGKAFATTSVVSDRRDRQTPARFVDLVVWERQAQAAAEHLVKGQALSFTGRFEPGEYTTSAGKKRLALEVQDVAINGPKPRPAELDAEHNTRGSDGQDIPCKPKLY